MASRPQSDTVVKRDTSLNLFKSIRGGIRRASRLLMSSSDWNDDMESESSVEFQSEKIPYPSGPNVQKVRTEKSMSLQPQMINVAQTYEKIEQRQLEADQLARIQAQRRREEQRKLEEQMSFQNVEDSRKTDGLWSADEYGLKQTAGKRDTTLQLELML